MRSHTHGIEQAGRAAVIAALLLSACGAVDEHRGDPIVAEAWQERLYRSDLRRVIPPDASPEDSAALARGYVDNWARGRALLHKAEENLTDAQKNVNEQLREYRESLITYAYEQALVAQKLDTNISEAEIARYYEANAKNFELKDNIVQVRWFEMRDAEPRELKKVEQLWRSAKPEDRHDLEVLLAQRGSTINDTHEEWLAFSDLQARVPLRPDNPTDWLPRQGMVVTADSAATYYVEFLGHRLKDSSSPIDLVRSEIRAILINQRKLQLIEQMREDLYQDALARQHVKVH